MRNHHQNMIRNPTARNASLTLLAILVILLPTPAIASADSLSVEMNKAPPIYNIGDSVSLSGTATPNASVSIKLLDPSDATKVESEVQVASDGNYTMESIYILKVTDEPGTWRVDVIDLSSNETAEAVFEVIAIWERLETLEGQLTGLQNTTDTLEGTVKNLETLVENLSSRVSAMETSLMIAYGAIVISVVSLALSIVAITRYLQKRYIYRKLVGKTQKGKARRR